MPSASLDVGFSGMRRLTAEQYRNTVRDLLKMPEAHALVSPEALPGDGALADRFTSNVATRCRAWTPTNTPTSPSCWPARR